MSHIGKAKKTEIAKRGLCHVQSVFGEPDVWKSLEAKKVDTSKKAGRAEEGFLLK